MDPNTKFDEKPDMDTTFERKKPDPDHPHPVILYNQMSFRQGNPKSGKYYGWVVVVYHVTIESSGHGWWKKF